jgi:hypothetical protein
MFSLYIFSYVAFVGSAWEIVLSYLAPMKSHGNVNDSSDDVGVEVSSSSSSSGSVIVRDHKAGNFDACPLSPISIHPHADAAAKIAHAAHTVPASSSTTTATTSEVGHKQQKGVLEYEK